MTSPRRRPLKKSDLRVIVKDSGVTQLHQLKRRAILHLGFVNYDTMTVDVFCGRELGRAYHVPFHWFFWQNCPSVCWRCRDQLKREYPEAREHAHVLPFSVLPAEGRPEVSDG